MFIERVLNSIESVIKIICSIFLAVIVIVVTYAVVMRYLLRNPPPWSMELSTFMYIWLVMLGAVLVTRDKSHINITVISEHLPEKARFVWYTFLRLVMVGFCGVMIQQGCRIYKIVAEAASPSFGISMGWLYLSVPASGFLMGIYFMEHIIKSIMERQKTYSARRGSR